MDGTVDEYAFVKLTGEASEDQFGAHVVGNGDIDDDGMDDLMVSAPLAGGTYDTGTVYVFYGTLAGTISAAEAGARFDGSILGDHSATRRHSPRCRRTEPGDRFEPRRRTQPMPTLAVLA